VRDAASRRPPAQNSSRRAATSRETTDRSINPIDLITGGRYRSSRTAEARELTGLLRQVLSDSFVELGLAFQGDIP
jgi:hypothetical protein